ncbi:MAG: cytochrome c5 family protein [Burkholderiaceae bacterium]
MKGFTNQPIRMVTLLAVLGGLGLPALQAESRYPVLTGTTVHGRDVWLGTCESCHAYGIAGSPNPDEPDAWRERLKKPRAVLHEHAINGFFGPEDTHMPPRGGNPALSDEDVQAAVDYMIALALRTLNQAEEKK